MSNQNHPFWLRQVVVFWGILLIPAIPSSAVLSQNDRVESDYLNNKGITCLSKGINSQNITKPSGIDQSIPYLIIPRQGFLDTRQPQLRWNQVKDATAYTVKIVRGSEIVWQKEVKEAEFNSSEDLPLEPGVDYSLIVEADNGRSSEMDSEISSTSFQLLDEDKIKSLADDVTQITALGLSVDEEALELANLYFGGKYGLIAKATDILEQRIAAGSQTSEVYVTVGNLYRVVGLYSLAEKRYRKALALIKPGMELEEQIIAKAGLAEICTLLGDEKEAKVLMQERKEALKALSSDRQSRARASARSSCNCDKNPQGKYEGILINGLCYLNLCVPG